MQEPAWPHAPTHRLGERGTYFVTAAAYLKQHYFRGRERLAVLHDSLLSLARKYGWQLEAWAVFSNHYHFVGHSPEDAQDAATLPVFLNELHQATAAFANKLDNTPARKVWHNYRESQLTYERSYYARLNYTHQNAVKHALVPVANVYPWCSAAWFERTAKPGQVKTIYGFKTDRVNVPDEFKVDAAW